MANLSKNFKSFKLSPSLEDAIENLGYREPTEVQKLAIPAILNGIDLVVSAQTGTGKTAAFCLPIIENLLHSETRKALVLVPTREIGIQINDFIKQVCQDISDFKTALLIGGEPVKKQEKALSYNPRIIIASPGRLVDLMERNLVKLNNTGFLIIDEADRLLDMGFLPQLNQIVNNLPPKRQSLLFSATINADTTAIAKAYTRKAQSILLNHSKSAPLKLETLSLNTTKEMKFDNLLDELNSREGSVILFAKTKQEVEFLYDELSAYAYPVNRIHGDRTQAQRSSAVKSLKNGEIRILVATDVAARGLDIPSIEYVFNYEPPQLAEDYTHRIGRTARAGAAGQVLNFITAENQNAWELTLEGAKKFSDRNSGKKSGPKKKSNFQYRSKKKSNKKGS
ncbi:MAG: DEAD/DEAH box helicase [Bdellovibrionota bacterium]|nr:DEAD/DEAH box helicase [Bdellovibrionota bacterium]